MKSVLAATIFMSIVILGYMTGIIVSRNEVNQITNEITLSLKEQPSSDGSVDFGYRLGLIDCQIKLNQFDPSLKRIINGDF